MNKMKMSAIVLGLAAAGAMAQTAPAAAPAEQPAAAQDSVKAAEEAKALEAKKAEEEKAAAEAKKAEEEKAAAEAKKAEEEKAAAEAKKAEEEKAAAEAKKAEEEKAAAEAKKAEEAKTAEAAPAAEDTNPGEVSAAADNALSSIKASMSEGTSKASMEVKMSGEVKVNGYLNDVFADGDITHSYYTLADLNFDVKFNDKWSAFLGIEAFNADGATSGVGYNGAYIQYKPADVFSIKVGDLTFYEGAFVSYYGYDDPGDWAVGMKKHDIRGFQIQLAGLELGLGLDRYDDKNYDAHVAYEFNYAGQHLRPYADYKSYQELDHNEFHAGIDAGLNIGGFSFRAVYGFHADYLTDDDDNKSAGGKRDVTSTAHAFLAEPSFEVGMFQIKTAIFWAFLDDRETVAEAVAEPANEGDDDADGADVVLPAPDAFGTNEVAQDIPENFFVYAEPSFKFAEFIKFGIPVEFHKHALDSDDDSKATLDAGARVYLYPVENLDITAIGMLSFPMLDNKGDIGLKLGLETHFVF